MKKLFLTTVLIAGISFYSKAQTNYAEAYATKIARKMKDSLALSESQRTQIYNLSVQLSNQKAEVWQQYAGNDSLIRLQLQRIENSRDSLYLPVLGTEKYSVYREKKMKLLSND